jgi:tetrahydromethanopterin S-methyltransferase subunit G
MPKIRRQGSQPQSSAQPSTKSSSQTKPSEVQKEQNKEKEAESQKPSIGGTAVPGAKSTQPREVTSVDPQRQQFESLNREMRRRLRQMKAGPYTEAETPLQRRRKRLEKRKQKLEQQRKEIKKLTATAPRQINLGRRLGIFIAVVVLLLVLAVVVAVLLHNGIL